MMKKYIYTISLTVLALAACSKYSEVDAPDIRVVHPDGMVFEADLGAMTKSYFGDADKPGQLWWEETDRVAIFGVPITGTRDSGWDHYIFNWTNKVVDLATVEVNATDPTKAILHTAKTVDDWLNGASQMMFFAIYPATEIPQIVRDEERDETNFLLNISPDQDGVHFGRHQILCSTTLKYDSTELASGTHAQFRPFSPGGTVLAFNVTNSTGSDLTINKIRITSQEGQNCEYPCPLTGAQSLFIDYSGSDPDEGPEAENGADFNRDVYYYVNLNLETPLTLSAGATSSQKYYAAVGHVYLSDYDEDDAGSSDLDKAYVRFEAMDSGDNILGVAERAYPNDPDQGEIGFMQGVRYDLNVNLIQDSGYHFFVVRQPRVYEKDGKRCLESALIRSFKVENGVTSFVDCTIDGVFSDVACTDPIDVDKVIKDSGVDTKEYDIEGNPSGVVGYGIDQKNNRNEWVVTSRPYSPSWNASVGDTDNYYNLSNSTGGASIENTANCYVINAPGYYTFPCVLGNGILNGMPNSGAWMGSGASGASGYIANLKDYMDGDITSPYVHNSSSAVVSAPTSACIIWEDVDGLIDATSYQLAAPAADANGIYWIKFHISDSKISQGNAVIAVKDADGNVMWSWHIWVTPFRFGADNNDNIPVDLKANGTSLDFAPVNLGFVEQEYLESITLEDDIIYVRLKQVESESGKPALTALIKTASLGGEFRPSANTPAKGYAPLWQFGRKDPLMPGNPATGSNIPVYGTAASFSVSTFSEAETTEANVPFSLSIRHPEKMIIACEDDTHNRRSYTYDVFNNLWNMTAAFTDSDLVNMDIPQRKSVYDPTPVGYQVPQPSDYYHFYVAVIGDPVEGRDQFDESKMVALSWTDEGVFVFGHESRAFLNRASSLTFMPYTGSRYHGNNGAVSPVEIKWPDDYTPINMVGMGLTNNREDSRGSAIGLFYFTYSYSESGGEYSYTFGPDLPAIYTEAPMGSGCDDASGFIRPVIDRSVPYNPLSFDGGSGAGSYNDVDL